MWSAGIWIHNNRSLSRLRSTQNDLFRKHLRLHRFKLESDEKYARRQNTELRNLKETLGIPDLDAVAVRRSYRYAGHVVRQKEYDPDRLTSRVLVWNCQRVARQNVRRSSDRQGFARFSPWTWEGQFSRFFDTLNRDWMEAAMNRRDWKLHEKAWTQHVLGKMAGTAIM